MFQNTRLGGKRLRVLMAVAVVMAMLLQLVAGASAETGEPIVPDLQEQRGLQDQSELQDRQSLGAQDGNENSSVRIVKHAPGSHDFFTFNWSTSTGDSDTFQLSHQDKTPETRLPVPQSGKLTVTEVVPPGWSLVNIECTPDGEDKVKYTADIATATLTVTFADHNNIDCNFHNEPAKDPVETGWLKVTKKTEGKNQPKGAKFSFASGTAEIGEPIADGKSFEIEVPVGPYTFSEITQDNWELTGVTCGNWKKGHESVTVHIVKDETIKCTFTNKYTPPTGSITITKLAPEAGKKTFEFSFKKTGSTATKKNLKHNEALTLENLKPGDTYEVTESAESGWILTDLTCDKGVQISKNGRTATFKIKANENLKCTFTNEKPGIVVVKETINRPEADNTQFAFDVSNLKSTQYLSSGESFKLTGLKNHTSVTITEKNLRSGWSLASLSCDDGTRPDKDRNGKLTGKVTVKSKSDKIITCTFTNEYTKPTGTLIIKKKTKGADQPDAEFGFEIDGVKHGKEIGHNGQIRLTLPIGNHTLSEQSQKHWELTGVVCNDKPQSATNPITVEIKANKTVTCTFTNTYKDPDDPTITIIKEVEGDPEVIPDEEFTIKVSRGGDSDAYPVQPGTENRITFTVLEGTDVTLSEDLTGLKDWTLKRAYCGVEEQDEQWQLKNGTITFKMPDANVTCLFINEYDDTPPPPPPPPPRSDEKTEDETPITPDSPQTGPKTDDEIVEELPQPAPASGPDLPFTGGNYLWHLIAGAALTVTGGQQMLVRRRRPHKDDGKLD